jgi:hypothetical protein
MLLGSSLLRQALNIKKHLGPSVPFALFASIPLYSKVDDPKSSSLNFMHFMLAVVVVWVRLEKSKITKT